MIHHKYHGYLRKENNKGQILFERLREIFTLNHICFRPLRRQDHQIIETIEFEFGTLSSERNYVSVWRNLFNKGVLHRTTSEVQDFVAYRVNLNQQFTKAVSPKKGLTVEQLKFDYAKHGFKIPPALLKEVEGYRNE